MDKDIPKRHLRKILVAYDGSLGSERAVETALEIGESLHCKVFVALCIGNSTDAVPSQSEELRKQLDEQLGRAAEQSKAQDLWVASECWTVCTREEILSKAEREDVDLIIVDHNEDFLLKSSFVPVMIAA
jgi:nucleotide-binding universal stress UspA family protein